MTAEEMAQLPKDQLALLALEGVNAELTKPEKDELLGLLGDFLDRAAKRRADAGEPVRFIGGVALAFRMFRDGVPPDEILKHAEQVLQNAVGGKGGT